MTGNDDADQEKHGGINDHGGAAVNVVPDEADREHEDANREPDGDEGSRETRR